VAELGYFGINKAHDSELTLVIGTAFERDFTFDSAKQQLISNGRVFF
jgi:hypothetical protein